MAENYSTRFKEIADKYYTALIKYDALPPKPYGWERIDLDTRLMELEDELYDLIEQRNHGIFKQLETDIQNRTGVIGQAIDDLESGKL